MFTNILHEFLQSCCATSRNLYKYVTFLCHVRDKNSNLFSRLTKEMKETILHTFKNSLIIIHKPIDLSTNVHKGIIVMNSIDTRFFRNVLKPFKKLVALLISTLISNVHKSIIVMNSLDTHFFRNVLKPFKKLVARVLSGLKPPSCAS